MWEDSLRRLEFEKIVSQLVEEAQFAGGKERAASLAPLKTLTEAERRLKETGEAVGLVTSRDTSFMRLAVDLSPQLKKVRTFAMLGTEELMQVASTLKVMRLCSRLGDERFPLLSGLLASLVDLGTLEQQLWAVVDENGELRDDASPELRSIRQRMTGLRQRIRDYLRDFVKSSDNQRYLQDDLITERNGRYVVPVRQEYRNQVRGIIHDESASGATVYIEPERVVIANNDLRKLEAEERREIERILREASGRVAARAEDITHNLDIISELDFILARARLALAMDAYQPELNERGLIDLRRARHPLIAKERAVPINLELGRDFDILVITGPNTGGKTVTLKTLGLLTVMAMAGLFVPAQERSCLSMFDQVFVDVGDEQSIEQSLSTFSSHMTNVVHVLEAMSERSLVLLDELGSGTDPQEGAALARAILEVLREKGVRAVVTTHHSDLKSLAYSHPRVQNACVEFDPVSLRPTYILTIGMPGQSNALAIARRLGLAPEVVQRAAEYIPRSEVEVGNMIRELKQAKREAEQEKASAQRLHDELRAREAALRQQKAALEEEYERRLEAANREARRYLREAQQEAEMVVEELKQLLKNKETVKWHQVQEVRSRLNKLQPAGKINEEPWEPVEDQLRVGDYVEIKSLRQKGYILEGPNDNQEFVVQVGIIKVNVGQKDLVKRDSPDEVKSHQRNRTFLDKAKRISPEIDLRGQLAEEALNNLDQYLEDAYLAGLERVRIIHGKGTGALRNAVREYLADYRYVSSFAEAATNEGGSGVTIAHLNH